MGSILVLVLAGSAQAQVASDEELPAVETIKALHVDDGAPTAGADGSTEHPFSSIQPALDLAAFNSSNGIPTDVFIRAGLYRETLNLHLGGASSAPITIEGVGRVVVTGADRDKGWSKTRHRRVFASRWTRNWGLAAVPPGWKDIAGLEGHPIVRRKEMVFVNGRAMTQVLSKKQMRRRPKTFFVRESTNRLLLHPPRHTGMRKATVEIAERPYTFYATGVDGLTLRNVTFRHAAGALESHSVGFVNTDDLTVQDVQVDWNNAGGLGVFHSEGVSLVNVQTNHNGIQGMAGGQLTNLTVLRGETSFNNWRGYRADFVKWASGGAKFARLRGAVFTDHRAIANEGRGFWLDFDNEDVVVEQPTIRWNLSDGLDIEASQGPVLVSRPEICNNGGGITSEHSTNVSVVDGVIADNDRYQILITGFHDSTRPVDNWVSGELMHLVARQWELRGNLIASHSKGYLFWTTVSSRYWSEFASSLVSDDNDWRSTKSKVPFQLPGEESVDLDGWRMTTGQDAASQLGNTRAEGCNA